MKRPVDLAGAALRHVQTGGAIDLTLRQLGLLAMLCEPNRTSTQRTVRRLASELGVQKPIITRAAARFVSLGLIEKAEDVGDRRSVILIPTDAGHHLRNALRGA